MLDILPFIPFFDRCCGPLGSIASQYCIPHPGQQLAVLSGEECWEDGGRERTPQIKDVPYIIRIIIVKESILDITKPLQNTRSSTKGKRRLLNRYSSLQVLYAVEKLSY